MNSKLLQILGEERNNYAKDCKENIEREYGKIEGADYMLTRFMERLREIELSGESEE